jgi:hypothetical protein
MDLPSRTPLPTASERSSRLIVVDGKTFIESTNETIKLIGKGEICSVNGGDLVLSDLIVGHDAEIKAERLKIGPLIEILGNAQLSAVVNDSILIEEGIVIRFAGDGPRVGKLEIGVVGENYEIQPNNVRVEVEGSAFSKDEKNRLEHVLVLGETLGNCEIWKEFVQLSDAGSFEVTCDYAAESQTGQPALALVLRGVKQENGAEEETTFLGWKVTYWIVLAFVILILLLIGRMTAMGVKKRRRVNAVPLHNSENVNEGMGEALNDSHLIVRP